MPTEEDAAWGSAPSEDVLHITAEQPRSPTSSPPQKRFIVEPQVLNAALEVEERKPPRTSSSLFRCTRGESNLTAACCARSAAPRSSASSAVPYCPRRRPAPSSAPEQQKRQAATIDALVPRDERGPFNCLVPKLTALVPVFQFPRYPSQLRRRICQAVTAPVEHPQSRVAAFQQPPAAVHGRAGRALGCGQRERGRVPDRAPMVAPRAARRAAVGLTTGINPELSAVVPRDGPHAR